MNLLSQQALEALKDESRSLWVYTVYELASTLALEKIAIGVISFPYGEPGEFNSETQNENWNLIADLGYPRYIG